MRRHNIATISVVLLLTRLATQPLAQSQNPDPICLKCQPKQISVPTIRNPNPVMCLVGEANFTTYEKDGIAVAVGYWQSVLSAYGHGSLTVESIQLSGASADADANAYSGCDVVVQATGLLPSGTPAQTTYQYEPYTDVEWPTWIVSINANYMRPEGYEARSQDWWMWVMANEIGHVMGFDDISDSDCRYQSVMFGSISSNPDPFPYGPMCTEGNAIIGTGHPGNPSGGGGSTEHNMLEDEYYCDVDIWEDDYYFWSEQYHTYVLGFVVYTQVRIYNCVPAI